MTIINTDLLIQTTKAWNTHHGYTHHGQRIGALLLADGAIVFADIDRGIDGLIPHDYRPELPIADRVRFGYMHTEVQYWSHSMLEWETYQALRQRAEALARTAPSL
jgi:hypothetical protein